MRYDIGADDAGKRADVVVAAYSGASRSRVAGAVKAGAVRVNGETIRPSHLLEAGDVLEFTIEAVAVRTVEPQAIALAIVYEDDDVLVVDKPAGMVTHPAHGARSGTLVNALLAHAHALPGDPERAGLVHRLDRDTSGLLVVAKTEASLRALGEAMRARTIHREYLGLVRGHPEHPTGTIDGPIGRDPNHRLKYAIVRDGKPAITHFVVREQLAQHAELAFTLETGRTHQIRVHLAASGHPIVNDRVYGKREPRSELPGQALHAWRLRFAHPRTGAPLAFEVAPPAGYLRTLECLR